MRAALPSLIALALLAASAQASEPLNQEPLANIPPPAEPIEREPAREPLAPELFLPGAVPVEPSWKGDPMATDFQFDCFRERVHRAMIKAYEEGRREDAIANVRQLEADFPDTSEAEEADMVFKIYARDKDVVVCEFPPPGSFDCMSGWVESNTRSIIYDGDDSMVQIGFDFYRVGQALREYPDITVKAIERDRVQLRAENEFASKDYWVDVPAK